MKMGLSIRLSMLACLLLIWPLSATAASPEVGLLVRFQLSTEEYGPPDPGTEYLIYRDGLFIGRSLTSEHYPSVHYFRATVDPGALRRLKAALVQNRVGLIQAPPDCKAASPFPTSVNYESDLTWFGTNGRQNRFSTSDVGEDPCPAAVNNLVLLVITDTLPNTFQDLVTTLP